MRVCMRSSVGESQVQVHVYVCIDGGREKEIGVVRV